MPMPPPPPGSPICPLFLLFLSHPHTRSPQPAARSPQPAQRPGPATRRAPVLRRATRHSICFLGCHCHELLRATSHEPRAGWHAPRRRATKHETENEPHIATGGWGGFQTARQRASPFSALALAAAAPQAQKIFARRCPVARNSESAAGTYVVRSYALSLS
jgi:hypothetical protein